MQKNLEVFRQQIDEVDRKLVELLAERFSCVKEIGKIKKDNNIEVVQNGRWTEVLKKVEDLAIKNDISQEFIHEIWELIHQEAIRLESSDT